MKLMKTYLPLFLITAISWSTICLPVTDTQVDKKVTVHTTDGQISDVSANVLKTSTTLLHQMESYPDATECTVGINAEEFKAILPFLELLAHGETDELTQGLTALELSKLVQLIETANFLNIEPLIAQGTARCAQKLSMRSNILAFRQNPKNILTQLDMLSPEMDNAIATQIMESHPDVQSWLLNHCTLDCKQYNHNYKVLLVQFNNDCTRLATLSGNRAKIWDAQPDTLIHTLFHYSCSIWPAHPDGTRFAICSEDTAAKIWDALSSGTPLHTLSHVRPVRSVQFSPDGTKIATGSEDNTAKIWDTNSGNRLHTLDRNHRVDKVLFSPDGTLLVTVAGSTTVKIWEAQSGNLLHTLNHYYWVGSVQFSPDSTMLATGSGNTAKIWDAQSGALLHTHAHDKKVNSVCFSPDGTRIATCSDDKKAKIWETQSGELLHTLAHDKKVNSVCFSPDGTKLATRSGNTAKIWEAQSGELLHTLAHDSGILSVQFSPDGTLLATISTDTAVPVKIWNLTPPLQLKQLQNLSLEQALTIIALYNLKQNNDQPTLGNLASYFDSLPEAIKNIFLEQLPTIRNEYEHFKSKPHEETIANNSSDSVQSNIKNKNPQLSLLDRVWSGIKNKTRNLFTGTTLTSATTALTRLPQQTWTFMKTNKGKVVGGSTLLAAGALSYYLWKR